MQKETYKELLKAVETHSNKLTLLQAEVKDIKMGLVHMTVGIDVTFVKQKDYLTSIIALNKVVWIILLGTAGKDKIRKTR